MNPHELARLSDHELSDYLLKSLREKDFPASGDCLVQIQARFDRLCATTDGCRQFLGGFLPLAGSPEVRALHPTDKAVEAVARLEHLLELAGIRARRVNDEAVLRQIVDARERGMDLLRVLAAAPRGGLAAGELATRLKISAQNLSPLLSDFHAHGLVDRMRQGRNIYVTLTRQGRTLLPDAAPAQEVPMMFLNRPMTGRRDLAKTA